jgi:hypothetical protein
MFSNCKNFISGLIITILYCALIIACSNCAANDAGAAGERIILDTIPAYVELRNQSQFNVKHFFVYKPDEIYQDAANKLEESLQPGNSYLFCLNEGDYFFTVSRLKNQDGPLFAFSLKKPLRLNIQSKQLLEFLENDFRLTTNTAGISKENWDDKKSEILEEFDEYLNGINDYENNSDSAAESAVDSKPSYPGCYNPDDSRLKNFLIDEPCICPPEIDIQ